MSKECRLCLGPCDGPTHQATERVHAWLRRRVTLATAPVPKAGKPGNRVLSELGTIGRVPRKVGEGR